MWHVPEENVMFKLSSLEIERQHTALLEKKERTLFFVVQSVQTLLLARDFLRAKVSNEIAFSKFSKRMSATGDEAGYSARKNKPFYFHGNFVCPYNLGVSSTYYFFCLLSLSLPNVSG